MHSSAPQRTRGNALERSAARSRSARGRTRAAAPASGEEGTPPTKVGPPERTEQRAMRQRSGAGSQALTAVSTCSRASSRE